MWRLKNLMHGSKDKEHNPALEGKTVEVGQMKVHVRQAIAEGGFSCVYLVRDLGTQKQYALKHIICNDLESLDLVKKEVAVMKVLRGHPNVVSLHAQTLYDLGRTKECFLVMDFCEKSLVRVLEARGTAGFFDENQILVIFRDVCNAVYAMHSQSPPIAHRDLKAENVLMGADGLWKLCDFGSTSTNHKRFERPEEMGIEEDVIRKHTTPAYRAPEMWDLYNRELISEKVDIWALGCLLYRLAYLKSAFDGESKLQILNGNYRIPELPKYSSSLVNLIKDMLKASPEDRPDIMQRYGTNVNELLPIELRKSRPDGCSTSVVSSDPHVPSADSREHGPSASFRRNGPLPSRPAPPLPASSQTAPSLAQTSGNTGIALGAFWSTQYAQEAVAFDDGPVFDKEPGSENSLKHTSHCPESYQKEAAASALKEQEPKSGNALRKNAKSNPVKNVQHVSQPAARQKSEEGKPERKSAMSRPLKGLESSVEAPTSGSTFLSTDNTFNTFVADFDNAKITVSGKDSMEEEIDRLREELAQLRQEKQEITSKYEKLSAICRSQRQEIQELKQLSAGGSFIPHNEEATPKSFRSRHMRGQHTKEQKSAGNWQSFSQQEDKKDGSLWELHEGTSSSGMSSKSSDANEWRPFSETYSAQRSRSSSDRSNPGEASTGGHAIFEFSGAANGHRRQQGSDSGFSSDDKWGFAEEGFTAQQPYRGPVQTTSLGEGKVNRSPSERNNKKSHGRTSESIISNQPAGWAGF